MKYLLLVLLLGACVTPQTGQTVITAGPQPSEAQSITAIKKYLERELKDPDSLKQFRVTSGPEQISWYRGLVHGGGNAQGWLYCFEYNAKNSYGAYTGVKTDGVVLRMYGETAEVMPAVNWHIADRRC